MQLRNQLNCINPHSSQMLFSLHGSKVLSKLKQKNCLVSGHLDKNNSIGRQCRTYAVFCRASRRRSIQLNMSDRIQLSWFYLASCICYRTSLTLVSLLRNGLYNMAAPARIIFYQPRAKMIFHTLFRMSPWLSIADLLVCPKTTQFLGSASLAA